jgi:hypothetical protein
VESVIISDRVNIRMKVSRVDLQLDVVPELWEGLVLSRFPKVHFVRGEGFSL